MCLRMSVHYTISTGIIVVSKTKNILCFCGDTTTVRECVCMSSADLCITTLARSSDDRIVRSRPSFVRSSVDLGDETGKRLATLGTLCAVPQKRCSMCRCWLCAMCDELGMRHEKKKWLLEMDDVVGMQHRKKVVACDG